MAYRIKNKKVKEKKIYAVDKNKNEVYILSYANAEDMGIKPNDSLIGTTYDIKKKEIIGYTASHTFMERDDVKLSKKIKAFAIIDAEGNEFKVYATSPDVVKKTIGYGNHYEEEWGDYAGLIKQLKNKEAVIVQIKTKYIPYH